MPDWLERLFMYVGVAGLLALMTTIAMIAWVSFKVDVPEPVWTFVGASWSYYFATNGKAVVAASRAAGKHGE